MYIIATFEVLDPRIKLGYYEDHIWEKKWIEAARSTFQHVYESEYEQDHNTTFEENEEEIEDNIDSHIYGRKLQQSSSTKANNEDGFHVHLYGEKSQRKRSTKLVDEVQRFLNETRARLKKGEDALSWWKVSILGLCIFRLL